jgi:hypothetical protein
MIGGRTAKKEAVMFVLWLVLSAVVFLGGAASSVFGFVLSCQSGLGNPSALSEFAMFFGVIAMIIGLIMAFVPSFDEESAHFEAVAFCVIKIAVDVLAAIYANGCTPIFGVWILILGWLGILVTLGTLTILHEEP